VDLTFWGLVILTVIGWALAGWFWIGLKWEESRRRVEVGTLQAQLRVIRSGETDAPQPGEGFRP